jgi:hypothetical protein
VIFESKVLRRPIRLCLIVTKLQWLAKTIPRLLRVRHAERLYDTTTVHPLAAVDRALELPRKG